MAALLFLQGNQKRAASKLLLLFFFNLYEKIKLECSKDGSEVGRYIILKNDKKI